MFDDGEDACQKCAIEKQHFFECKHAAFSLACLKISEKGYAVAAVGQTFN